MDKTQTTTSPYNEVFFSQLEEGSLRSARETLPIVLECFPCQSVVDVGCGVGAWLRVCKELGVRDVLGLDGDYVNPSRLQIAPDEFQAADLADPAPIGRQFDLALSLEVAEHLPAASSDRFVDFLTAIAPVVLFSAAVPQQGGTSHVNEQWPEYWIRKFERRGFVTVDYVRGRIWTNRNVDWWYAQNMLLFVRSKELEANPTLRTFAIRTEINRLSLIHPGLLAECRMAIAGLEEKLQKNESKLLPENMHFLDTLRMLPAIFAGAVRRRLRR